MTAQDYQDAIDAQQRVVELSRQSVERVAWELEEQLKRKLSFRAGSKVNLEWESDTSLRIMWPEGHEFAVIRSKSKAEIYFALEEWLRMWALRRD